MEERPKVGVGVVVVKDGKILIGERLVSHGAGTWMIPGGHLELGETFEECALREVYEETGLTDLEITELIRVGNDRVYDKHFVTIGMVAVWKSGEPKIMEPGKSENWKWIDPNELPENIFLPSKWCIENWLAKTIYLQNA